MNKATFNAKLISVMKDNMFDREIGHQRSGKLNSRALFKAGFSSKLFKKKLERKGKNYTLSLLVDCSGSMAGSKMRHAIDSTVDLMKAFDKIPTLKYEVVGFNTFDFEIKPYEVGKGIKSIEDERKIRALMGKISSGGGGDSVYFIEDMTDRKLYPPPILIGQEAYEKKWNELKGLGHELDTEHTCQGNCDGYTIERAVERLKKTHPTTTGKEGKIMIVMSDGRPSFDNSLNWYIDGDKKKRKYLDINLKDTVDRAIRNEHIAFVGVGIQTDIVFNYYPKENCVAVEDTDELYGAIAKLLDKHIKRK